MIEELLKGSSFIYWKERNYRSCWITVRSASNYSGWRYRWNDWRFKRIYSYFSDYGAWFLTILSNRCGINSICYCVNGLRLVFVVNNWIRRYNIAFFIKNSKMKVLFLETALEFSLIPRKYPFISDNLTLSLRNETTE
jgi:hypothetical protein